MADLDDRISDPIKYLSNADIRAVSLRLNDAATALLAMHRLAIDAGEMDQDGYYRFAIQELARSTFRGLDACIVRLEGGAGIGNFRSEFDDDDEDAAEASHG